MAKYYTIDWFTSKYFHDVLVIHIHALEKYVVFPANFLNGYQNVKQRSMDIGYSIGERITTSADIQTQYSRINI